MTDARKYRMRLVRAHMDYITAEINDADTNDRKYDLFNLILKMLSSSFCTIPVSNVIVESLSSPKPVRICSSSQVPNVYVAGLV